MRKRQGLIGLIMYAIPNFTRVWAVRRRLPEFVNRNWWWQINRSQTSSTELDIHERCTVYHIHHLMKVRFKTRTYVGSVSTVVSGTFRLSISSEESLKRVRIWSTNHSCHLYLVWSDCKSRRETTIRLDATVLWSKLNKRPVWYPM